MATLTVGSGQQFTTLTAAVAAAQTGDTIQVQAGTYTNNFPGYVNSLTIEGVGGQVNLVATAQPPNGKAILDVGGNTTLKNLTFSGVTDADGNGAGVRYEGGTLSVQDCIFHDNQDGLLAAAAPNGTISIDSSEFYNNGTSAGNAHNIYIGDIQQFTLTNSYIHNANVGHEVKSRAENNTITGNRIFDNSSTSSYSIDLPNGGNANVSGNTIEQGPNGQNPTIIAYGEEGGANTLSGSQHNGTSLTLSNNTIVNDLTSHTPLLLWNAGNATINGSGNVLYGLNASELGSGVPASAASYTSARPTLDTSSPVTTLTPAPTPTPTPTGDTLVLQLSEDAWRGNARFTASLDGKQLDATQAVTALHAAGQVQDFTYTGSFGIGPHDLAITFLNDVSGRTPSMDRNLYVNGVVYDGAQVPQATAALYSNSTVHFQVGAAPSTV